ncbi:hypothetical protein IMSAG025_02083 [Muribaculaceae bacterium]|nr:hypothetical protein IMSAG025_02083 [Muribaculaceae bacterium]
MVNMKKILFASPVAATVASPMELNIRVSTRLSPVLSSSCNAMGIPISNVFFQNSLSFIIPTAFIAIDFLLKPAFRIHLHGIVCNDTFA